MGQNLSIHQVLLARSKARHWPYFSSIMIVNKNVPRLEEYFGQLDYDWLLRVTKDRSCKEIDPCVFRYVNGENLSLNPEYRKRDFYMGLLMVDENTDTMKRWFASRARYHYVMGEMPMARFYFARGAINWKTIMYYLTSYNKTISKWIVKKYRVFG